MGCTLAPGHANDLIDGRFVIQSLIAETRTSTVYCGLDLKKDQPVAIKVMKSDAPRALATNVVQAARALASVGNSLPRGIVRIVGFFEWRGQTVLVSALFDGLPLQKFVAQRSTQTLEHAEAVQIVAAAAGAVQGAIEHGIVHGDLSPNNILVNPETLETAVTDFGGVAPDCSTGSVVQSGSQDGANGWAVTADFCAPEVRRGRAPDDRSEVYSLGVILFWALVGEAPSGYADQWDVVAKQHSSIRQLLQHSLCHAADRYSLDEFLKATRDALQGHALVAARRALRAIATEWGSDRRLPIKFVTSRGMIEFKLVGGGTFSAPSPSDVACGGAPGAYSIAMPDLYVSGVLDNGRVRTLLEGPLAQVCARSDEQSLAMEDYGTVRQILCAVKPARLISELEFEWLAGRGVLTESHVYDGVWTRNRYRPDWGYRLRHGLRQRRAGHGVNPCNTRTVRGLRTDGRQDSWISSRACVRIASNARFGVILVVPADPACLYIQPALKEKL